MNQVDPKKMNYAELNAYVKSLDDQLQEKKSEAMDVLIDRFLSDAKASQFPVDELIAKIQKKQGLKPSKGQKKGSGSVIIPTEYEKDAKYVNPENPKDIWMGGAKGPKPKWLLAQLKPGMGSDERAQKFLELKQS